MTPEAPQIPRRNAVDLDQRIVIVTDREWLAVSRERGMDVGAPRLRSSSRAAP
jgi:hypothetical protein